MSGPTPEERAVILAAVQARYAEAVSALQADDHPGPYTQGQRASAAYERGAALMVLELLFPGETALRHGEWVAALEGLARARVNAVADAAAASGLAEPVVRSALGRAIAEHQATRRRAHQERPDD